MLELATRPARTGARAVLGPDRGSVACCCWCPCALLGAAVPVAPPAAARTRRARPVNLRGEHRRYARGFARRGLRAGAHARRAGHARRNARAVRRDRGQRLSRSPAPRDPGRRADARSAPSRSRAPIAMGRPAWNPTVMSAGAFRPVRANELRVVSRAATGEGSVVARAVSDEHLSITARARTPRCSSAATRPGGRAGSKVGGKVDASTKDMETQVLLLDSSRRRPRIPARARS